MNCSVRRAFMAASGAMAGNELELRRPIAVSHSNARATMFDNN
jgi:hypothetical protein